MYGSTLCMYGGVSWCLENAGDVSGGNVHEARKTAYRVFVRGQNACIYAY